MKTIGYALFGGMLFTLIGGSIVTTSQLTGPAQPDVNILADANKS